MKLRERKPAEGIDSIVVSFQDFEILRKKQSGENLVCWLLYAWYAVQYIGNLFLRCIYRVTVLV